jgi:hypothetical protein
LFVPNVKKIWNQDRRLLHPDVMGTTPAKSSGGSKNISQKTNNGKTFREFCC